MKSQAQLNNLKSEQVQSLSERTAITQEEITKPTSRRSLYGRLALSSVLDG